MAPRVTSLLHYSSSPGGCHNFTVTQGEAVLWNNILIVSKNIHLLYLISCGSGLLLDHFSTGAAPRWSYVLSCLVCCAPTCSSFACSCLLWDREMIYSFVARANYGTTHTWHSTLLLLHPPPLHLLVITLLWELQQPQHRVICKSSSGFIRFTRCHTGIYNIYLAEEGEREAPVSCP